MYTYHVPYVLNVYRDFDTSSQNDMYVLNDLFIHNKDFALGGGCVCIVKSITRKMDSCQKLIFDAQNGQYYENLYSFEDR